MTFRATKAYINLQWMDVLVVSTEEETKFKTTSFVDTNEADGKISVITYVVRPFIWKHYPPGHDATNPDAHQYMFIIQNQHTQIVESNASAEYAEALNILGVETEEEEVIVDA